MSEEMTFEDAYSKLSNIIEALENSQLPLNDALARFEEGQKLAAFCQQLLDQAELRISQLIDGEVVPIDEE